MDNDGQLIQVIIGVLIGAAYVIAAIVKKIDQWIQTHRMPPENRRDMPPPSSIPEAPPPAEPKPDLRTILMRELQKSLSGETEQPHFPPLHDTGPFETALPAPPLPEGVRRIPPAPKPGVPAAEKPARKKIASTVPVVVSLGVQSRRENLFQTPADVRRAIVLHEILSPPLSKRGKPAFPRQRLF